MGEQQYGERIASLEAIVQGQNALLRSVLKKLDGMETLMRDLVSKENFKETRVGLGGRLDDLEKEVPSNLTSRLLKLEGRTPAIIQYVVIAFMTGGTFWVLGKLFP